MKEKYQTIKPSNFSYVPKGKPSKDMYGMGKGMGKYASIKGGYEDAGHANMEAGVKAASKMDMMSKAAKTKAKEMLKNRLQGKMDAKTSQSMAPGAKSSYSVAKYLPEKK